MKALYAWSSERFPASHGLLFLALFVATRAITQAPLVFTLQDVSGFFAVWSFFLLLRICDEHKDYALDCQNYPDRVLQSGRITLGRLRVLGAICVVVQAAVSGAAGALFWWVLLVAYVGLMTVEFFVGEWLEKRLVLYAVSHMLVMPLVVVWMAHLGTGEPRGMGALSALVFFSGAAFEVTRKTRGPEEERDTVDSYSKIFGTRRAPAVVLGLLILGNAAQFMIVEQWLWRGALVAFLIIPAITLHQFKVRPSAKLRQRNEAAVSISMLLGYALLIAYVVVDRGVSWS